MGPAVSGFPPEASCSDGGILYVTIQGTVLWCVDIAISMLRTCIEWQLFTNQIFWDRKITMELCFWLWISCF